MSPNVKLEQMTRVKTIVKTPRLKRKIFKLLTVKVSSREQTQIKTKNFPLIVMAIVQVLTRNYPPQYVQRFIMYCPWQNYTR